HSSRALRPAAVLVLLLGLASAGVRAAASVEVGDAFIRESAGGHEWTLGNSEVVATIVVTKIGVQIETLARQGGRNVVVPAFGDVGVTIDGAGAIPGDRTYRFESATAANVGGRAELTLGDAVQPVLEAHVQAGGGRFRGIRNSASWDADTEVLGPLNRLQAGHYLRDDFRAGFKHLAPMGLSFDAWLLEPQLPELTDLARAFPDTTIVLDHVGTPIGRGSYAGKLEERFPIWKASMLELAKSPNVVVKLGGMAMAFCNFPSFLAEPRAPSEQIANEWRPYVETCVEAFGAERCMFESNFPVDMGSCTYAVLWNAFKHLAKGASATEKTALFSGTASKVYKLELS
uniref:amidohydrolase family protein n=1 Tax=uncultured Phenylobacterium sp. TaxID=349273 RepID=UPI0025F42A61